MEQVSANLRAYIYTEQLHRKVFDTIYMHGKTELTSEERDTLQEYYRMFSFYPDFRKRLYDEYKILDTINHIAPYRLSKIDLENLESLMTINFSRYGFKL